MENETKGKRPGPVPRFERVPEEWSRYGTFIRNAHLEALRARGGKRPLYAVLDEAIERGLAALPVVPGLGGVPGEGE